MGAVGPQPGLALLALYDEALPQVYGYLLARCGSRAVAEDLSSETFLAAVTAARGGSEVSLPWLIGTARHKLVDHWRRLAREERGLSLAYDEPVAASGVVDCPDDAGDRFQLFAPR